MTARLSRNFAFNVAGLLLPVVVSLVTVPFYIHLIGPARYGIVSITWVLLGYLGFLDFGLSRASANALGRLGHASTAERAPVFMTALYLNIIFGAIGGAILFFGGGLLLRFGFSLPDELRDEALAAFPWMAPMLPLGMIVGVATGALESRERFLLSNLLNGTGLVLGQVLPLICAYLIGPTLGVVIPALLLVRLLVVVAIFGVVAWLEWPLRPFGFNVEWARKLFGYGTWVSVSTLISPLLETFDQVLIGRMLGVHAITYYSVPMSIALRSQVMANALARTLFPRISREDAASGRRLTTSATLAILYMFGAICAPGIILASSLLALWIDQDFAAQSHLVAEILLLGAWANGVALLPYSQLQAQGKPRLTALVHLIEVAPFVVLLWALIKAAGLPGAAMAWALRVGVDSVAMLWLAGCLHGSLARAVPGLAMMAATFLLVQLVPMGLEAGAATGVLVALSFVATGVLVEPTLRNAAGSVVALVGRVSRRAVPH